MKARNGNGGTVVLGVLLILTALCGPKVQAGKLPEPARGGTVYIPAYSHVYHGDKERPFYVTTTLSIRNVDLRHPITVQDIDYYDFKGQLLRKCIDKPVILNPQGTEEVIIRESDKSGGFGAHFIVRWKSGHDVDPPIMETVIIGSSGQQGISFTSRGVTVRER